MSQAAVIDISCLLSEHLRSFSSLENAGFSEPFYLRSDHNATVTAWMTASSSPATRLLPSSTLHLLSTGSINRSDILSLRKASTLYSVSSFHIPLYIWSDRSTSGLWFIVMLRFPVHAIWTSSVAPWSPRISNTPHIRRFPVWTSMQRYEVYEQSRGSSPKQLDCLMQIFSYDTMCP